MLLLLVFGVSFVCDYVATWVVAWISERSWKMIPAAFCSKALNLTVVVIVAKATESWELILAASLADALATSLVWWRRDGRNKT